MGTKHITAEKVHLLDFLDTLSEVVIAESAGKTMTIRSFVKQDGTTEVKYIVYQAEVPLKATPFIAEAIIRYNSL